MSEATFLKAQLKKAEERRAELEAENALRLAELTAAYRRIAELEARWEKLKESVKKQHFLTDDYRWEVVLNTMIAWEKPEREAKDGAE